jgi:hypothetical protein
MRSPGTIVGFAAHYRICVTRDDCGDQIIRGKLGHVYQHDANQFGIVLEASANVVVLENTFRARKRRAIAAGFSMNQEGDFESILLFDPGDAEQARLAIRLIQAKKIKQAPRPSDAQLRARALFSLRARSKRSCFDQNTNAIAG